MYKQQLIRNNSSLITLNSAGQSTDVVMEEKRKLIRQDSMVVRQQVQLNFDFDKNIAGESESEDAYEKFDFE